jgi:hypothetical protein
MSGYPVVVTAYTRGTQYATLATRLTSSALRWGLSVYAEAYDSADTWRHNVNMKRTIIRRALERFGAVLWVDADGEIVAKPEPVLESVGRGVSFAAYNQRGSVRPGLRIHGGTLFFQGPGGLLLLRAMENFAARHPESSEQSCLDQLTSTPTLDIHSKVGWGGLHWWPQGMCKIREYGWAPGENQVEYIRQYQGSRTGRTEIAAADTREQQGPASPV